MANNRKSLTQLDKDTLYGVQVPGNEKYPLFILTFKALEMIVNDSSLLATWSSQKVFITNGLKLTYPFAKFDCVDGKASDLGEVLKTLYRELITNTTTLALHDNCWLYFSHKVKDLSQGYRNDWFYLAKLKDVTVEEVNLKGG